MIDILWQIGLIAVFSVWFAEISTIPNRLRRLPHADPISTQELKENIMSAKKRLKPFDCPMCLAWWIALNFFIITGTLYLAPIYAACASTLAVFISKQLNK